MTLSIDVEKKVAAFSLVAQFDSDGQVTALFGRSGAGKTTLVNLIAGLIRPDRGRIAIGDTVLIDTAAGIDVPTHRRGIGYVFQEGRLFPHMSVRGNLTYGRRFAGNRPATATLDGIAAMLAIAPLLDRRPADLSGGEKQRVAIGRALLANPRLLLMDEPLAALDQGLKGEILPYIERLRDEMHLPIVYVSHAIEEVARLADTLVLLDGGVVAAAGSVNQVLARLDLRDRIGRFEAGTVLHATIVGHDPAAGTTFLDHPAGHLTVPLIDAPVDTTARLRVRARDVTLAAGDAGPISIRNRLATTVAEIAIGERQDVEVKLDAGGEPLLARVTRAAAQDLDLEIGQPIVALIKTSAFDRLDEI